MTRPYRTLSSFDDVATVAQPPESAAMESDYVVILAALLCGLICLVGLMAVAHCAWLRRQTQNQHLANKGIKKKMIEALPKFTYDANRDDEMCGKLASSECAICLGEYVNGDEIRVLPQCGHRFHVECIDTWLTAHSSCPSCRQLLVARRCKKCGEFPTVQLEAGDKCKHNGSSCSTDYLP